MEAAYFYYLLLNYKKTFNQAAAHANLLFFHFGTVKLGSHVIFAETGVSRM